jgi:hypothetical protein
MSLHLQVFRKDAFDRSLPKSIFVYRSLFASAKRFRRWGRGGRWGRGSGVTCYQFRYPCVPFGVLDHFDEIACNAQSEHLRAFADASLRGRLRYNTETTFLFKRVDPLPTVL